MAHCSLCARAFSFAIDGAHFVFARHPHHRVYVEDDMNGDSNNSEIFQAFIY